MGAFAGHAIGHATDDVCGTLWIFDGAVAVIRRTKTCPQMRERVKKRVCVCVCAYVCVCVCVCVQCHQCRRVHTRERAPMSASTIHKPLVIVEGTELVVCSGIVTKRE
jgi:hypothetical protein